MKGQNVHLLLPTLGGHSRESAEKVRKQSHQNLALLGHLALVFQPIEVQGTNAPVYKPVSLWRFVPAAQADLKQCKRGGAAPCCTKHLDTRV